MIADIFMYIFGAAAVIGLVILLIKKANIILSLMGIGVVLLIVSMCIGRVKIEQPVDVFFPLQSIGNNFKTTLSSAGFTILILGGYTGFMTIIDANNVIVNVLTKPLLKIKKTYVLLPIVFILGNILSLAVPSASTLAIILMATLFPILVKTGINPLAAAGVIATTATIMPTPLGSDNVAVSDALGMSVTDYVFLYHATVSLPTILIMTFAHIFWQKYMDKRDLKKGITYDVASKFDQIEETKGGKCFKTFYTILPLLPVILMIISFIIGLSLPAGKKFDLSVEVVTLMSFLFAIICEWIRHKSIKIPMKRTDHFWKGMGNAMEVVVLLVAANVFVAGLTSIGLIEQLQKTMETTNLPGITLPLIMLLLSALIVILSGSGTSLVFAMAPLLVSLSTAAKIPPEAISIPLQLSGNLFRSMSPVAAVIIIVAKNTDVLPMQVVKRTIVPVLTGVIVSFALAMTLFLTGIIPDHSNLTNLVGTI